MLNLLLVDDEYIVLKGLESMLATQTRVDLHIETAMDGIEALKRLERYRPDVIIADINMPEMDGLSLLETISGKLPDCRFIICSGYETIDYYKRALKVHVIDYLAKPIDKHLLISHLETVDAEKKKAASHLLLKIQAGLLKNDAMLDLEGEEARIDAMLPFPHLSVCVFYSLGEEDVRKTVHGLSAYIDKIYPVDLDRIFLLLLNCSYPLSLQQLNDLVREYCPDALFGISALQSSSSHAESLVRLPEAYLSSLLGITASLILEKPSEDADRHRLTLPFAIKVNLYEESTSDYIDFLLKDNDISDLYTHAFLDIVTAYLTIGKVFLPRDELIRLYESCRTPRSDRSALITLTQRIANAWFSWFSRTEGGEYSSRITDAVRFMETHFASDLTLDDVACQAGFNPSYFSYLFHKETGTTFLQYLNGIRLEHACMLLKDAPQLSIDEVSRQAGFRSTSYFHKVFRARFGMSPRQWVEVH